MPRATVNMHGYTVEEDEKDQKRLKLMYPEPGHRETFVKGVMPVKSVKPDRKS